MIVVRDLNAMDQISISTQNSEYQFQVTEPARCRGVLSGGRLGNERFEAIAAELEIGTCALFYIAAEESLKCLTTSLIINLKIGGDVF